MKSEQINELASALAKAQAEIESAAKSAQNPHFKSRYADLASIRDACQGPLSKHGLSVTQTVESGEHGFVLVTSLMHSSGQWIEGRMGLILQKNDMQGLGSALTYARRYSLAAIVGVAQDDDDGAGAGNDDDNTDAPAPTLKAPTSVRGSAGLAPDCACGGGKMMISKYNPNEYYCSACRAKRPVRAA